ncbi:MAG: hypothetical protein OEQ39_07790 [Gammaproteobacteria bacterium]|nr:hypothetical protein [Gammaproteobacteria bacterium]MDH3467857.1 hypothetical protein [Gammaproteobacteria bacterium]
MAARLVSNRGTEHFELGFVARRDCGPDPGVDCQVRLVSSSWAEGEPRPITITLGTLHLSLVQIRNLVEVIESWITKPVDELALEPLEAEIDLMFAPQDFLLLKFGSRDDTIAELGKPVLTVDYKIGSTIGVMHFTTDPTCLSVFVDSLKTGVAGVGYIPV